MLVPAHVLTCRIVPFLKHVEHAVLSKLALLFKRLLLYKHLELFKYAALIAAACGAPVVLNPQLARDAAAF